MFDKRKLWLDDERPPPSEEWFWAQTLAEAVMCMQNGLIDIASLDHDLGLSEVDDEIESSGYRFVLWMAHQNIWPRDEVSVHSMNSVGAHNMCKLIERYGPYKRKIGQRLFVKK